MSRQHRRSFLDRLKSLFFADIDPSSPETRRHLRFEGLEGRQLMAADVGLLTGHVYRDFNGNGHWDGGELGVDHVQVQLWRDNGDGIFGAASDSLITSTFSDPTGAYSFGSLDTADYFVLRPAQVLASGQQTGLHLPEKISGKLHVDALKTVIDNFDSPTTQTAAADSTDDGVPATSIASGLLNSNVIGGEREIITNFTGDAEGPGILTSARVSTINVNGRPEGLLMLDATSSAKGTYTLIWDGSDGTASTTPNLNGGLGGVNLRDGGADHLRIKLNSLDLPGSMVRITVYSDATRFSTGTVTLTPRVIDGVAEGGGITDYRFNFDGSGTGGFAIGSGALGGADFSSVRGIVMTIDVPSDVDARLELLGAYGSANQVADLAVDQVDVSVDKQVDNPNPLVGSTVNYTLKITNAAVLSNGLPGVKATGVTATDTLFTSLIQSGKLTYISDTSGGAFNSATGVWQVGELNPGETRTAIVTMRVNQSAMPSTTNTLRIVSLFEPDIDLDDWTDDAIITVKNIDIAVNKTVNNTRPDHNDVVEFTVTAQNVGTADALNVTLNDAVSALAGFQVQSIVPSSGTFSNGVWSIPSLAAGQSVTLKITGLVTGCDPVTNSVSLGGIGGGAIDTNSSNNQASVTVTPQEADLGVTKAVVGSSTPFASAPNVTFQLMVTNNGPDTATSVVISDSLPSTLVFLSADSGDYSAATGQWNVGTIAVGQSRSLMVMARLADGVSSGVITNTATVTHSDQCDENSANDSASASVSPQLIDLSVTKAVNNTVPALNSQVTFTMTVTNSGPSTATGVSLKDQLPSGLVYVGSSATQGSYNPGDATWSVGTVGVNQTHTLTVIALVTSPLQQINIIEVLTAGQDDIDSTPNNGIAGEDDIASVALQPQTPLPQGDPEPLSKRRFLAR